MEYINKVRTMIGNPTSEDVNSLICQTRNLSWIIPIVVDLPRAMLEPTSQFCFHQNTWYHFCSSATAMLCQDLEPRYDAISISTHLWFHTVSSESQLTYCDAPIQGRHVSSLSFNHEVDQDGD